MINDKYENSIYLKKYFYRKDIAIDDKIVAKQITFVWKSI